MALTSKSHKPCMRAGIALDRDSDGSDSDEDETVDADSSDSEPDVEASVALPFRAMLNTLQSELHTYQDAQGGEFPLFSLLFVAS